MRGRNLRLQIIKNIIEENHISSQEILLSHLKKEQVLVTQATLSRDLKMLKVGKVSDGKNGYFYTMPGEEMAKENEKDYIHDLVRGFMSLEFSANIALLRTLPGHADSVALALDSLNISNILGTIAGDDTLLIVLKENVSHDSFRNTLLGLAPDLEL